jgi:hypothetical protein
MAQSARARHTRGQTWKKGKIEEKKEKGKGRKKEKEKEKAGKAAWDGAHLYSSACIPICRREPWQFSSLASPVFGKILQKRQMHVWSTKRSLFAKSFYGWM